MLNAISSTHEGASCRKMAIFQEALPITTIKKHENPSRSKSYWYTMATSWESNSMSQTGAFTNASRVGERLYISGRLRRRDYAASCWSFSSTVSSASAPRTPLSALRPCPEPCRPPRRCRPLPFIRFGSDLRLPPCRTAVGGKKRRPAGLLTCHVAVVTSLGES